MNCRWVFWLDPVFLRLVLDNLVSLFLETAAVEHIDWVYRAAPRLGGGGSYTWVRGWHPRPPLYCLQRWGSVGGGTGICYFERWSCHSVCSRHLVGPEEDWSGQSGSEPGGKQSLLRGFPQISLPSADSLTDPYPHVWFPLRCLLRKYVCDLVGKRRSFYLLPVSAWGICSRAVQWGWWKRWKPPSVQ